MAELESIKKLKNWAKNFKSEVYTLYLAYRDPRVPWYAKLFIACVVGYAFSPIDLIPDFIPVLGYLDDLVLIPLGVTLALKMIPEPVLEEARKKAIDFRPGKPKSWGAAIIIIAVWVCLLVMVTVLVIQQ
ncbi:YkvA family protein [Desulfotomaculum nigrificans]|uniref:YkvA family protein n=1 Tax=Desulfotomaculum nigrificans TaxID=1565 RepID=UPI0001FAF238|nr:YkvA family protein [Desulfotomaculum nigrificans]